MPKIHVNEAIVINDSPENIYNTLSDFHHWQSWSPWLLAEPDARVDIASKGDFYEWEGKIVGAGQMQITQTSEKFDFLGIDLTFLKPWKSEVKVAFFLEKIAKGTSVRWTMDSSLPFFLFWMKKSMIAFISEDYTRGLRLLKDQIETGNTNSKIVFQGIKKQAAIQYVGFKRYIKSSEIEHYMEKDYSFLMPLYHQKWKTIKAGHPFTIYHKWDLVNKKVEYTAAVPLTEIPIDLDSKLIVGNLSEMSVYSVQHEGPYRHIANAWSAAYMHMRSKRFNALKKAPPMEVYWNSPKDTAELKLKTEILFPAKD